MKRWIVIGRAMFVFLALVALVLALVFNSLELMFVSFALYAAGVGRIRRIPKPTLDPETQNWRQN